MLGTMLVVFLAGLATITLIAFGLRLYLHVRFLPRVVRIFEEAPFFAAALDAPAPEAEEVSFRTCDGLTLRGSYWTTRAQGRRGVILFCHEFTSHRWSCRPYCEPLLASGFDIFTFDFRNHGQSDRLPGYDPLQWVTDYEVADVKAALHYLETRKTADSPRVGILGISKGGTAALAAAVDSPGVSAMVTDGAFPTHGMQVAYMRRWVEIYSKGRFSIDDVAVWIEDVLAHWKPPIVPGRRNTRYDTFAQKARRESGRRRNCRFVNIEAAVCRLQSLPWLMIQGAGDSYVLPEVAKELFRYAGPQSTLWMVPRAKHNKSLQVAGDQYRQRLCDFFIRHLDPGFHKTTARPLSQTDREPLATPVSRAD